MHTKSHILIKKTVFVCKWTRVAEDRQQHWRHLGLVCHCSFKNPWKSAAGCSPLASSLFGFCILFLFVSVFIYWLKEILFFFVRALACCPLLSTLKPAGDHLRWCSHDQIVVSGHFVMTGIQNQCRLDLPKPTVSFCLCAQRDPSPNFPNP